jgi:hypothetical protein
MLNKLRVVFCKTGMVFVAVFVTLEPTFSNPDLTLGIYFLEVIAAVFIPVLKVRLMKFLFLRLLFLLVLAIIIYKNIIIIILLYFMSEIVAFIKENYVSIAVLVSIIFALLIIISIIGWNLNPPKPELKLVQQVTVEAFEPLIMDNNNNNQNSDKNNISKELDNLKLNPSDSFCQSHLENSAKLEQSCGQLIENSCQQTKCCIWAQSKNNKEKCMAGDKNGPTYTKNLKTMSSYYWQGIKHNVN